MKTMVEEKRRKFLLYERSKLTKVETRDLTWEQRKDMIRERLNELDAWRAKMFYFKSVKN
jgi:hypothetical protein